MQVRERCYPLGRKHNWPVTVREVANNERTNLKTAVRYLFLLSNWPKFKYCVFSKYWQASPRL